jgi:hypothetical protein
MRKDDDYLDHDNNDDDVDDDDDDDDDDNNNDDFTYNANKADDDDRHEFSETLKSYEKTWLEYEASYKSMRLYKVLVDRELKLGQLQLENNRLQTLKQELQQKLQAAQGKYSKTDIIQIQIQIQKTLLSK